MPPLKQSEKNIKSSGLDYSILRPDLFSSTDEVDYSLTKRETGNRFGISGKTIKVYVGALNQNSSVHISVNPGISKP